MDRLLRSERRRGSGVARRKWTILDGVAEVWSTWEAFQRSGARIDVEDPRVSEGLSVCSASRTARAIVT
jgi:hypothetical protein